MTYQSKPTSNGVYRIKVLNQNLYIQSVPGYNAGLTLAPLSPSDNNQKWNLTQVGGQSNTWTIVSVQDQSGVTYQKNRNTYWGYGYPYPQSGPSQNWSILEQTSEGQRFSKIRLSGASDCFDSCSGSDAVHFYYSQSAVSNGPRQCFVFELVPTQKLSPLDVIFIQDATASQQTYINIARSDIGKICNTLKAGNFATPNDLRFGVIAFRDHPPQEQSFVTMKFPFTSDVNTLASILASFPATGGGGGPEAQSDALSDVLKVPWNNNATKVAVLITDSPPHGTGEANDAFPNGGPLQVEPLRIAKRMASIGIKLYVVACEPTLSRYKTARSFYEGLVAKTGGKVVNIGDPNTLASLIIASVPYL